MKKYIITAFVLAAVLTVCACGQAPSETTSSEESGKVIAETTAPEKTADECAKELPQSYESIPQEGTATEFDKDGNPTVFVVNIVDSDNSSVMIEGEYNYDSGKGLYLVSGVKVYEAVDEGTKTSYYNADRELLYYEILDEAKDTTYKYTANGELECYTVRIISDDLTVISTTYDAEGNVISVDE